MLLRFRFDNALVGAGLTWRRAVAALMLAHFLMLLGIGLTRHWGFMTSINDLGMFDQAIWGILHGKPFLNTTSPFQVPMNWLGWHFNPVLVLFAPFYAIAETPVWLILAQAAALSLAAWPIFLLAVRMTGSELAGCLWTVAYLANPFLLNAAAWDFHAVSLAVPFAALGMLAVEERHAGLLAGCCLFLLTVQEHMGLMVAGFGALWWLRHADRRIGIALILLGLGHTGLVFGVIMPALSPSHTHPMLSEDVGFASRYGWLGVSLGEIVLKPLLHPVELARTVLLDFNGGLYLVILLLPLFFFPLAGLSFLLPAIADLAVNLLSSNPLPRSPFSYHSAVLVPVFTVAAIHGARNLCQWQRRFGTVELACLVAAPVAAVSLATGHLLAPLPLPGSADLWAAKRYPAAPDPELGRVLAALPSGASVSVQANVGSHFSHRDTVHVFPDRVSTDNAVVLHLESPTRKLEPRDPGLFGSLAHHLQMDPEAYLATIGALVADPDNDILLWQDPWLVLVRRRGDPDPLARVQILARLRELHSDWKLDGTRKNADREDTAWRH